MSQGKSKSESEASLKARENEKEKAQGLSEADFYLLQMRLSHTTEMTFKVVSDSMEPLIMTGEKIKVRSIKIDQLHLFDIIVFLKGEKLICHYIWHMNTLRSWDGLRTLTTKNMPGGEDLPVPENQILGIVTSHKISGWLQLRLTLKFWLRRKFYGWRMFLIGK